jgi:hypothetical protein
LAVAGALLAALGIAVVAWRSGNGASGRLYVDDSPQLVSGPLFRLIDVPDEGAWPERSKVGTGADNELLAEPCRESTGTQAKAVHVAGQYAGPDHQELKSGLDIELFDFGTSEQARTEQETIEHYFRAGCRPNLLYQDAPSQYWLRFSPPSGGVYPFTIETDRPLQEGYQQVTRVGQLLLDAICWGPHDEWGRCGRHIDATIARMERATESS